MSSLGSVEDAFFYQNLDRFGEANALINAKPIDQTSSDTQQFTTESIDYQSLHNHISAMQQKLAQSFAEADVQGWQNLASRKPQRRTEAVTLGSPAAERVLIILKMHNTVESVVDYLAALQAGMVCLLLDPQSSKTKLDGLIDAFKPNAIVDKNAITLRHTQTTKIDKNLAILLPTSGSTGAAKHVALSYDNLQSNAEAICEYLPIELSDTAISSLPLFYSYGLSVLNTHLLRGAAVFVSPFSIINREFWQVMQQCQITSFAGVPHTYEMLQKLRFTRRELPYLKYLTQAGGKLAPNIISHFVDYAQQQGKQFFVMYGQTEATARMAYTSDETLSTKPDVIGKPIDKGQFKLHDGELYYSGPNVMLGYAESRGSLANFETMKWLNTGDLATVDEHGDYCIVGRTKRFIKVFGHRIDLDHIEFVLSQMKIAAYCCGVDGQLVIGFTGDEKQDDGLAQTHAHNEAIKQQIISLLHKEYAVHPSVLTVIPLSNLPVLANGKKDYQSVLNMALDNPNSSPINN